MHGGHRPGSGRKPGFSARSAEEARRYFSQRVAEEIEPLADMLLEKAKEGDIRALKILLDRAFGRPRQEILLTTTTYEQKTPSPRILGASGEAQLRIAQPHFSFSVKLNRKLVE